MTPWQKHLREATGYLELGMPHEAACALDAIALEERARPEVIDLRVGLCMAEKQWARGMELARHLVTIQPEEPGPWISLAYCTRRAESVDTAEEILLRAMAAHPAEAMIRYNLACYACVSGRLDEARQRLKEAIVLNECIRELAVEDEDLRPLWKSIPELT